VIKTMMTCKEAAQLISEERDHPLSFGQKFGLRMHLALCELCRGYKKNLEMLSSIAARAGEAVMTRLPIGGAEEDLVLSAARKHRIKEELERTKPSG
jgi:hypothetical protein